MNLRSTALFYALLLSLLWGFGLMLAWKKTTADETAIVPSLQLPETKIETILIERRGGNPETENVKLAKENDLWYLVQAGQKTRVEGFKVDQLVNQIKNAKNYEDAPIRGTPADFGLQQPEATFVLQGKQKNKERVWKFYLGRESPDKYLVYVNSSDRPDQAFAVTRTSIDNLYLRDPSALRMKRLFEFNEPDVTRVDVKQGPRELELKRSENNTWRFEKPALGFADFETKAAAPAAQQAPTTGGVKGLLAALTSLRVEDEKDFVPLGSPLGRYGLEAGQETLRVEIEAPRDKDAGKEVLLVGKRVPGQKLVYARLLAEEGVVQLSVKQLAALEQAVAEPGAIRSRDVAVYDAKAVDLVKIGTGKNAVQLTHVASGWQLQADHDRPLKANEKAVEALLEALQGKKAIVAFTEAKDEKKADAEQGLATPGTQVEVYVGALAKDDKKQAATETTVKKDAQPLVKLEFGKQDKETVHVKRTLADGTVSRFTLPTSFLTLLQPPEGAALAFLDRTLPAPNPAAVAQIILERDGKKQELERRTDNKQSRWFLKDAAEPSGVLPADAVKVNELLKAVTGQSAQKWLARNDAAALEKYGLKSPGLTVTLVAQADQFNPAQVAATLALLCSNVNGTITGPGLLGLPWAGLSGSTTYQFGQEESGQGVAARQAGSERVYLASADLVKALRTADLRDRTVILNLQPELIAAQLVSVLPLDRLLLVSPLATAQIGQLDPTRVQEIKFSLRTAAELRTFAFQRGKDGKDWQDVTGLQEFKLDAARVHELVAQLSRLRAERLIALTGGPRGEQKLDAKEYTVQVELKTDAGPPVVLKVGTNFERQGYFAHSSTWPGAVFLLSPDAVEPLLRGVGAFSKDRLALNP